MKSLALVALIGCGSPAPAPQGPTSTPSPTPSPAKPAAPAPAPTTGPVGSGGAYGTASPTLIRAYDKQERWMALCQARQDTDGDGKIEIHSGHHGDLYGDAMKLYVIIGGGNGTEADYFVGRSDSGRYFSVIKNNKLVVVDGQTGVEQELAGADIEPDGRPGAPHRAGVWAKERFIYIRHGKTDGIVVHDPATHAERELPMTERVWRMEADAERIILVATIPPKEAFPSMRTTLAGGECLGPPMSYSTYGQSGPKPTLRYIDLDTGKEAKGDGIVATIGQTLVRAPKDGALYLDNDQIAPPTCAPQVLAVMPSPPRVIAICGAKKQARILLLGKNLSKELAAIDREQDHYGGLEDMLESTGVVCGSGLHCVATATSQPIDLKGGVAEYVFENLVYVVHATLQTRTHEVVDVATGKRTPTKAADSKIKAGNWFIDYNGHLVDLRTGVVGKKVSGAMRLSENGRILKGGGGDEDFPTGPLQWTAP